MRRISSLRHRLLAIVLALVSLNGVSASADAITFPAGSLIVPMDIDPNGQDRGMLRAYGLVYELLRAGIPVHWTINELKVTDGVDFTVSGVVLESVRNNTLIGNSRAYRGGPFVVAADDAPAALSIIEQWQNVPGDETVVHRLVSGSFTANVSRRLVAAPRIAIPIDGGEQVAFNNLNAAGIRDAVGGAWSHASPDVLTEQSIVGGPAMNDGALFLNGGQPRYCYLASMHYNETSLTHQVARETRSWLAASPLHHAFMQCEAIQAFENAPAGAFLTTLGLQDDGGAAPNVTSSYPGDPLSQMHGLFAMDSGAIDSIGLNGGSTFKPGAVSLFSNSTAPPNQRMSMISGRLDGSSLGGRVTYLAGHDFSLGLPISSNPQTNGVRLFLNALLASDCATVIVQPDVTLSLSAPAQVTVNRIQYTLDVSNPAAATRPAENVRLSQVLPAGAVYVTGSATVPPLSSAGGTLSWSIGSLAPGQARSISFAIDVPAASGGSVIHLSQAHVLFSHLAAGSVSTDVVATEQQPPVGPQGPPGPEGPMGPMGPMGPVGPMGPTGPEGPAGPAGPIGPEGPAGPTGPIGPAGPAGPAGPMGPEGPRGPEGPQGAQGPAGQGLFPGALIFIERGKPVPPGFTFVGSFSQQLDGTGPGKRLFIDIYRKD
ncbi:MAG TPA: hypothetical protein VNT81_12860 [Vicinamibacterales bacterium]|nr:hypothetical protein [Vicinamibacterales bacterium]